MGSRSRRAHGTRSDDAHYPHTFPPVNLRTFALSHSRYLPDTTTDLTTTILRTTFSPATAHTRTLQTHPPMPLHVLHAAPSTRYRADRDERGLRETASSAQDRPGQMHSWPRPRLTQAVSRGHVHQCRASTRRQAVLLRTRSVPQWCFVAPQLGGARDQPARRGHRPTPNRHNASLCVVVAPLPGQSCRPPRRRGIMRHAGRGAAARTRLRPSPLA